VPTQPASPTPPLLSCAECESFEFKRDHPIRHALGYGPSSFSGFGEVMLAAMGARVPTHYERHRDEFARTGDPLALERMLRQVE
jgi:hypothetical protein